MPDPKLVIEHPDGTTRSYVIRSRIVKIRGGEEVTIHFLARDDESPRSLGYQVREHPRGSLPLEWQITAARALVQLLGRTPEEAAEITGGLKARVEGLAPEQAEEVLVDILAALNNEE